MGRACRYDGGHCRDEELAAALAAEGLKAVPFCPEEHGGLGTPRPAAWIGEGGAAAVVDGEASMLTKDGVDVTAEFLAGARGAAALCEELGIRRAFLKERSPSCGVAQTHVGGELTEGPGVTAEVLGLAGVRCQGVEPG
ncbi:MAG: hypothetical protein ACI8QC_002029 [Planctomycetota bacterium]|jgi:uncharacterized protein YbbK (DUF523 family)